jgi:hypothetical protein
MVELQLLYCERNKTATILSAQCPMQHLSKHPKDLQDERSVATLSHKVQKLMTKMYLQKKRDLNQSLFFFFILSTF